MVEINLDNKVDLALMTLRGNKTLKEVVNSANASVRNNARNSEGANNKNIIPLENLVDDFVSTYFLINCEAEKRGVFANEKQNDYFKAIRTFGLYNSSKAILNLLYNESIERNLHNNVGQASSLAYSDIDKDSDVSQIISVLKRVDGVKSLNGIDSLKYRYFKLFDEVKDLSKNMLTQLSSSPTRKLLNDTTVIKQGYNFKEILKPVKSEYSKNSKGLDSDENIEKLPTELKLYIPKEKASIDRVIGNRDAISALGSAIMRLNAYNPKTGKNLIKEKYGDFIESFIIHGPPGVGKNFTIDSLINDVNAHGDKYDLNMEIVDLSGNTLSMWKDRSALIFERYLQMQNLTNKCYVNIIDEADALIGLDERGNISDSGSKIIRELKSSLGNGTNDNKIFFFLTNYPEQFEAAFSNRCQIIKMDGPTCAQDFARSYELEFAKINRNLNKQDYLKLGELAYQTKNHLGSLERPISFSFRDIELMAKQFSSNNDLLYSRWNDFFSGSSQDKMNIYDACIVHPTYKHVEDKLYDHIEELKSKNDGETARANMRV